MIGATLRWHMPGDERGGCQGEGRKEMKEDIAGSNERGTRREERTRQGKEIGQIYRKKEGP